MVKGTEVLNIQLNPELAKLEFPEMGLVYTKHALFRCEQKRLPILTKLAILRGTVVECEPYNQKLIVRIPNLIKQGKYDLVLVLKKQLSGWLVLTTYRNHCQDNHQTLKLKQINL